MATKGKQEVTTKRTQLPVAEADLDIFERMEKDAGRGISTKASDNLVPLLKVLQPLSPEVSKSNPNHIKGASAGDFLAKALATPVMSGEDGFYFQPVAMYQEYVEWIPRGQGGGFVARHAFVDGQPPEHAKAKKRDPGSRKPQTYAMGENDLVDTRYVPGYMWEDGHATPFVIPFTSTGHAVARGWMTKQGQLQLNGKILPAFAAIYKLTTVSAKNNLGEWYKIEVSAPIPLYDFETKKPNKEAEEIVGDCRRAYEMGDALNTAFEREEKQAHFERRDDATETSM